MIRAALVLLALAVPASAAAQGTPMPFVKVQFFTNTGAVCTGCLLNAYAAGTTTRQNTYTTVTLTPGTENTNPIVLDSAGRATVYLSATSYRFVLTNSTGGTTYWDADNTPSVPASGAGIDLTSQVAGEALAAGDVVYLSDGSGSLVAGRWYKADADLLYASSGAGMVGIVPTAIASAATGTVRIGGRATGLSGLTSGTDYFVSTTAGALTATAPTFPRFVGRADTTTTLIFQPNPRPIFVDGINIAEGRLTATTATPVTTADVSGATSIFYTPYKGNRIALYDGTALWNVRSFTEITISVATCTANRPHDVFLFDNAGTVTAETLVWTSATARATALTTQNGVLVKSGATTRRYVGSFYCNASGGQTDDTFAKRYVWNYYNRIPRPMRVLEATDTWTYTTATYRQANAATANQLDVMVGVAEVLVDVSVQAMASSDQAAGSVGITVAIGEDSTTTAVTSTTGRTIHNPGAGVRAQIRADLRLFPAVGRHTYVWLERSAAAGTTTWVGDNGADTLWQSGIFGWIEG